MPEPIQLSHPRLGLCQRVAVEGTDWIVLSTATGKRYRVPSFKRQEFVAVTQPEFIKQRQLMERLQARTGLVSGQIASQEPQVPAVEQPSPPSTERVSPSKVEVSSDGETDRRRLRRIIESLRNGLPPTDATYAELKRLTVGLEDFGYRVRNMLHSVQDAGGFVKVVRAVYGQGKSASLLLLRGKALEEGFIVAQTEVDASENRLDRPSNIYRDLMRNLRFPDGGEHGARGLALRVAQIVRPKVGFAAEGYHRDILHVRDSFQEHIQFREHIQCRPLAWLLSDPNLPQKEKLLSLLAGENIWRVGECRSEHLSVGTTHDWPRFSASSQGDFACFLLSGIGRLAKLLGYKGLVVVLDEMEKWQDLSWPQQTRAGNLIGGLIWGATEQEGRRWRSNWLKPNPHQPEQLIHSGRAGGFPFTTEGRCHMGVVIAMTPRGAEGPEEMWKQFGPLNICDLPEFTVRSLRSYMPVVAAHYAAAFELPEPNPSELTQRALALWQARREATARSAIQAAIEALDAWRDSL